MRSNQTLFKQDQSDQTTFPFRTDHFPIQTRSLFHSDGSSSLFKLDPLITVYKAGSCFININLNSGFITLVIANNKLLYKLIDETLLTNKVIMPTRTSFYTN